LQQPLDVGQSDSGRAFDAPSLVYNSNTVNQRPIIEGVLRSTSFDPVPDSIVATLSIDSVAQAPVTFTTTGDQPGDSYLLDVQAAAALTSGIHTWQLAVQVNLPGGGVVNLSASGLVGAVDRSGSNLGAGFGLSDVDQLVQDPATQNVLWISGNGL